MNRRRASVLAVVSCVRALVVLGCDGDRNATNPVDPTSPSACAAGEVAMAGKCLLLCKETAECAVGLLCASGMCRETDNPPVIFSVDGTGSADPNSEHVAKHLRAQLAIRGQHIEGAQVDLISTDSGQHYSLAAEFETVGGVLLATLPASITQGSYTLRVVNQAGVSAETQVFLLQGEPGPAADGGHTITTVRVRGALGAAALSLTIDGLEVAPHGPNGGIYFAVLSAHNGALNREQAAYNALYGADDVSALQTFIDRLPDDALVVLASQGELSQNERQALGHLALSDFGGSAQLASLEANDSFVFIGQPGLGEGNGALVVSNTGVAEKSILVVDGQVIGLGSRAQALDPVFVDSLATRSELGDLVSRGELDAALDTRLAHGALSAGVGNDVGQIKFASNGDGYGGAYIEWFPQGGMPNELNITGAYSENLSTFRVLADRTEFRGSIANQVQVQDASGDNLILGSAAGCSDASTWNCNTTDIYVPGDAQSSDKKLRIIGGDNTNGWTLASLDIGARVTSMTGDLWVAGGLTTGSLSAGVGNNVGQIKLASNPDGYGGAYIEWFPTSGMPNELNITGAGAQPLSTFRVLADRTEFSGSIANDVRVQDASGDTLVLGSANHCDTTFSPWNCHTTDIYVPGDAQSSDKKLRILGGDQSNGWTLASLDIGARLTTMSGDLSVAGGLSAGSVNASSIRLYNGKRRSVLVTPLRNVVEDMDGVNDEDSCGGINGYALDATNDRQHAGMDNAGRWCLEPDRDTVVGLLLVPMDIDATRNPTFIFDWLAAGGAQPYRSVRLDASILGIDTVCVDDYNADNVGTPIDDVLRCNLPAGALRAGAVYTVRIHRPDISDHLEWRNSIHGHATVEYTATY